MRDGYLDRTGERGELVIAKQRLDTAPQDCIVVITLMVVVVAAATKWQQATFRGIHGIAFVAALNYSRVHLRPNMCVSVCGRWFLLSVVVVVFIQTSG